MGLSTGIKFIHNYGSDSDIEQPPPPTDILFGNSSITNADGTRSVVSGGTDTTTKLDLYSGQGLRFDGTQVIDTDFSPDLTKNFTLLVEQEMVNGWKRNGVNQSINSRLEFGTNADSIRFAVGSLVKVLPTIIVAEAYYSVFIKYNASTGTVKAGVIEGDTVTFSPVLEQVTLPLHFGNVNGITSAFVGGIKNAYFLPYELTDLELSSHLQNPEQTLYYGNGVLKSDLLTQSIVDDIIAGDGFWYPLCENNSLANDAFGSVADLSLPISQNIVDTYEWGYLGDNVYETASILRNDIKLNLENGRDYLLDIEILETNLIALRFWSGVGTFQIIDSTIGTKTLYLNARNAGSQLYNTDNGFVGKIRLSNLRKLQTITNYVNSPMRDNATKLPYGLQTSLIKQDSFGLPIGKAGDGELVWVDESYATPDVPLVLTGNFCADTYVKEIGTTDSTFLNFTTDTIDPILIGVAGATGNVDIALLTEYTSTPVSASGAVVSLERDGGTLKAFVNNVEVSRISYAGTVTLDIVGALSAIANFVTGESGSLGFTKTTRTYGQRLSTINDINAKHGVY